jgi:hypothetical protein
VELLLPTMRLTNEERNDMIERAIERFQKYGGFEAVISLLSAHCKKLTQPQRNATSKHRASEAVGVILHKARTLPKRTAEPKYCQSTVK